MRSTVEPTLRVAGGLVLLRDSAARRDLWIEGGAITRIGDPEEPTAPGEAVLDAEGSLVAPGLINAHTHSPLASLRGTTDGLGHVGFMWRNQADTADRDPQEIYDHAFAQALESLATGVTAMIDHFPEQNPTTEAVDAAAAAYRDAGIRCGLALRVFDGAYDDILPDPASCLAPPEPSPLAPASIDALIRVCDDAVQRWHGEEGRISILPAPSNPLRCSDDLLRACAELAEARDLGLHAHMLETRRQREISQARHGVSNVAHLDRIGVLSERWSLAHCVWVDADDLAALAATGATPIHNPASNAKLGVGTAPVAAMLEQGISVALGTDGASTSDSLDLHEAIWLAALLSRARGDELDAAAAYGLATTGGAAALRRPGVTGRIEPGATADLVLYDLDDPALSPLADPLQQLVFAARGGAVRRTLVAGRQVYERGSDSAQRLRDARAALRTSRRNAALRDPALERFAQAMAGRA